MLALESVVAAPTPWFWLAIGFGGQAIFGTRFIVQWIVSERQARSVIPLAFWWMSIVGSLLLLAYSIYKQDPVFILGQSMGSIVYFRNLRLIAKERAATGGGTK